MSADTPGAGGRTLTAGAARVVITPPVGIHLSGFRGRPASTGVHDDLTATALVLGEREGGEGGQDAPGGPVALLALDVLGIRGEATLRQIKAAIRERTGIAPERVFLNCSHTHYGPVMAGDRGGRGRAEGEGEGEGEGDEREGAGAPEALAYRDALTHHLAGVVATAAAARRPVTLAAGRGAVRVGINRRERAADGRIILGQNPEGPLDSEAIVWRFDAADGPPVEPGAPVGWVRRAPETVAVVVNYACHGVSLGSRMRRISADFPGPMRAVVERLVGGTALFLQGAAGDINPALGFRPAEDGDPWESPRRSGHALGAEAARVALLAEPVAALPLRAARRTLELPPMLPASVDAARERVETLEAERERLEGTAGNEGQRLWNASLLRRARRALEAMEGGPPLPPVSGEVGAVRIGDVALATNPSELFCEIGMRIKRQSPFAWTAVAGYTDGSVGYIPTRSAYPEGGYEVDRACRVNPEAGAMVEETSLRLLRELR